MRQPDNWQSMDQEEPKMPESLVGKGEVVLLVAVTEVGEGKWTSRACWVCDFGPREASVSVEGISRVGVSRCCKLLTDSGFWISQ